MNIKRIQRLSRISPKTPNRDGTMSNNAHATTRRSCYFCNVLLDEKYLYEHVKHCAAVLEECPYRCGVYVPRKNLEAHKTACETRFSKRNAQTCETQGPTWNGMIVDALLLMRSIVLDELNHRKQLQERCFANSKFLETQRETIDNISLRLMKTMEENRRNYAELNQGLANLELTSDNIERRTIFSFEEISKRLKSMQTDFAEEQGKRDRVTGDLYAKLNELETFLSEETASVRVLIQEQLQNIHDMKLELEMRCKKSKKLCDIQDALSEKVDNAVTKIQEYCDAAEGQEDDIKELKSQIKENFSYLQNLISNSSKLDRVECKCAMQSSEEFSINGRMLWRIDGYEEKMKDAKERGSALYSPRFSDKEYSYSLRMELYLNGRGQWKDRHVIGCLRVEAGKWDPLLDWPCILKATVILRDQENPTNDLRKMVKAVGQSQSDVQKLNKESGIYMFIPHTTLTRYPSYTKNNVMFLEVWVTDIRTNVTSSNTT